MDFLVQWLETNAVLLGSLAAVATIATLFLVNGGQIVAAIMRRNNKLETGAAAPEAAAIYQPVTDRPSLAFLPLTAMATNPEVEHLADGITEDVITGMARIPGFFVVSRNSTFVYKNMPHDIRQIGRDLGVRYVVEGSIRQIGEQLRVTVQLIEAESGDHVWAGNADITLENAIADHDRIINMVTASLQPQIMMREAQRAKKKPVEQLTVWELIHCAFSPLLLGFEKTQVPRCPLVSPAARLNWTRTTPAPKRPWRGPLATGLLATCAPGKQQKWQKRWKSGRKPCGKTGGIALYCIAGPVY